MPASVVRLGGARGVLYAALFVSTIFLVSPDSPTSSTTGPEIVRFFADRRDDMVADIIISGFIGLAFLGFLAVLRAIVSRPGASAASGAVTYLVGAGGIIYVALAYAGSVGYDVYAATLDEFDAFHGASPEAGFLLWNAGNWFVDYSAIGGGIAVGAASVLALRTRALPAWLAWLGLLVGVLAIANVATVYGFEAILVWTLVASLVMLVAPGRIAGASAA
jgi:hypothetical protein